MGHDSLVEPFFDGLQPISPEEESETQFVFDLMVDGLMRANERFVLFGRHKLLFEGKMDVEEVFLRSTVVPFQPFVVAAVRAQVGDATHTQGVLLMCEGGPRQGDLVDYQLDPYSGAVVRKYTPDEAVELDFRRVEAEFGRAVEAKDLYSIDNDLGDSLARVSRDGAAGRELSACMNMAGCQVGLREIHWLWRIVDDAEPILDDKEL